MRRSREASGRAGSAMLVARALAAALLAAAAAAHPIHIIRGEARVEGERVVVTLREPAGEPHHDHGHAAAEGMLARLIVRDERGEALQPRAAAAERGAGSAGADAPSMAFDLGSAAQCLTFQQRPGGDGRPAHLALAVRVPEDGGSARSIRLSPRGDAATVTLRPRSEAPANSPEAILGDERFAVIHAIWRRDGADVVVDAYAPLVLLETWPMPARGEMDFLTEEEQRRAEARLAELLATHVSAAADGEPIRARVEASASLGPLDADLDALSQAPTAPAPPRRLGGWSARIGVRLRFAAPGDAKSVQATWGLYNAAVLSARMFVIQDSTVIEHDLSPSARAIELRAGESTP